MEHSATPDEALRGRVEARDQTALRECFDAHAGAMVALARRVLGDDHRAEEVVQEVLLRFWNEPHRFQPSRGALRSFLYRETHSRAIERVRSEDARRHREARHHESGRRVAPAEDVERDALATIGAQRLRRALAALTTAERDAIELAYFGGHSYREVARLLDLPEGTVKSRIRLGLARLADALDATGSETFP